MEIEKDFELEVEQLVEGISLPSMSFEVVQQVLAFRSGTARSTTIVLSVTQVLFTYPIATAACKID